MSSRIFGHRKWLALVIGALMLQSAFAAEPAATATPAPAEPAELDDEELTVLDEVVVYGTDGKRVEGIDAESELDEATLATYGANTVGDLIGQVAPDVDNTAEGPVILVNGRPANGISSVNDLPAEVVQSVQVLPPQAAAALGYSPTRRVLNVVLKQTYQQRLANLTMRGATAGRGESVNGNGGVIKLQGNNFRDFGIRFSKTEPLLEAHRDVITQTTTTPYDLVGNVQAWPFAGGEIDPALSAMAGVPVTVAGVPVGVGSPTLGDFVPQANLANVSDMGAYRTLVSDSYSFGVNGNMNFQLSGNKSISLNLNADRSHSESRTGASTALLHVPGTSPFTPFSQDVAIARYLGGPLRQESNPWNANLGGNYNMQLGRWRLMVNGNFNWRESKTVSERRIDTTALQAAIDAGLVNPFDPLPANMIGTVLEDHARSQGHNASLLAQLAGTAFKLPAGNATLSLRTELRHSQQRSRTVGTVNVSSRTKRQDEVAFASLQLPLLGGASAGPNIPPGVTLPAGMQLPAGSNGFAMAGELSASARDASMFGTLFDYGYGLNWRWGNRVNMRAAINHEKSAPQPEMLNNPIVTVDDYRAYDFIRQETVLVRYITGGNPDLQVEQRRRMTFSGTLRPFSKVDFTVNAEYQRMVGHDASSALPAVSEDVQIAFPDRYIRDADGRLIQIDARMVSFARSETQQIRWGGNLRRSFGTPPRPTPNSGPQIVIYDGTAGEDLTGAGWRLNTNFTHTWQLENKRLARAGLPEQDLLAGGVGTGSGQSRHSVQGRVGLAYNGTGLQLGGNWKSRTRIIAGTADDPNTIVFSPLLRLDLSGFANLGTVFPGKPLLTNSRVTLSVENLLDAKQRVRDETGTTPLRYQPYLINSLGRTVSLSLRKTF